MGAPDRSRRGVYVSAAAPRRCWRGEGARARDARARHLPASDSSCVGSCASTRGRPTVGSADGSAWRSGARAWPANMSKGANMV